MADAGRALRMLVVPHFFQLGCLPLEIALLFIFYEIFGMITNLVGGHQGARMGLNHIMNIGLLLQILALGMLAVPAAIVVGLGTDLSAPTVLIGGAYSSIRSTKKPGRGPRQIPENLNKGVTWRIYARNQYRT